MRNEFTAIVERDGSWFVAYCAEISGPNGQGKTRPECLTNLREAVSLILEHRRQASLRAVPPDTRKSQTYSQNESVEGFRLPILRDKGSALKESA